MNTVEILIMGRVQKVGFRACAKKIASDLNVTGTVMNLPDGKVQIIATAEPIILEKFISMLYSCPRTVIRDVHIKKVDLQKFAEFSINKSDNQERI